MFLAFTLEFADRNRHRYRCETVFSIVEYPVHLLDTYE
jgi:hypothetical protein